MLVAGHPGGLHVTVMDGDIITPTNWVRQPFCSAKVGLAKAVVTVSRMNLFCDLSICSRARSYVHTALSSHDTDA
jgi:hypothetical protein